MSSTSPANRMLVVQTILIGIGLYVLLHALFYGKQFIVPLVFATIFAILLDGAVVFLEKFRINRTLAVLIMLFLALTVALGLIVFIVYQGSHFVEDIPKLTERLGRIATNVCHWIAEKVGVADSEINEVYEKTKGENMGNGKIVRRTLTNLSDVLALVFLMPVYIFMLLYFKSHLLQFLRKLLKPATHPKLNEIIASIKSLVQFYLVGILTELVLVATLNATGLFIIGVEYALLLGLISGVMNMIPYIGSIIAGILAMIVALSSNTPLDALWVMLLFTFVQMVDNTFFVPLIVGSRVQLNALVSLVGVVAGGVLWGIGGMILSIPVLGILKVIFDHTTPLEPWGFLLGDREQPPPISRWKTKRTRHAAPAPKDK